jgi:GNAT superfamily N-acetyltransferase
MSVPDALRAFAEDPDAYVREVPSVAPHTLTPKFVVAFSPSPLQSVTCRVRTTVADLDATIEEVRALLRERGVKANVWHVGPSSQPHDLAPLLRARSFVPASHAPYEPTMTLMALVRPPRPNPNAAVEVRMARTLEEYVAGLEVMLGAFNASVEEGAAWRAAAPTLWETQDGDDRFTHVAFLDGRLVGAGFSVGGATGILMGGGGVLPLVRGRGVYRALLAARWAEAERLGKQGLVIQAGAMSRPILERCGFEVVGELHLFDDVVYKSSAGA